MNLKFCSKFRGVQFLLSWVITAASAPVAAIDTPSILPANVRAAVFRTGTYNGLNEYYTEDGNLRYLSDKNSFELSMVELARIDARLDDLRRILNEFGRADLGNQLHLGKISVEADPSVRYYAPVFAYGWSKKLTVGIAVPIVSYTNKVKVTQTGSNLESIRAQVEGANAEIDNGFRELDSALSGGVNRFLRDQDYDSLENRQDTFIGDVQLLSFYQLSADPQLTHTMQFYLNLPTGPKPDPNDLTDLENFGRYSVKAAWIAQKPLFKKTDLLGMASYLLVPPQKVDKRVPKDDGDILPDAQQNYNLTADYGDVVGVGTGVRRQFTDAIYSTVAYAYEYKMSDSYSGAPGNRESFLEDHTEKSAHIAKLEIGFSTVKAYLRKQAIAPIIVAYEFNQTVAGVNVENQSKHELTFNLYF